MTQIIRQLDPIVDRDFVKKLIAKYSDYLKVIAECKDLLDWNNKILFSKFAYIWQSSKQTGLVVVDDIVSKMEVVQSDKPNKGIFHVNWYSLPDDNELEPLLLSNMGEVFQEFFEGVYENVEVKGVKITNGISSKQESKVLYDGHKAAAGSITSGNKSNKRGSASKRQASTVTSANGKVSSLEPAKLEPVAT